MFLSLKTLLIIISILTFAGIIIVAILYKINNKYLIISKANERLIINNEEFKQKYYSLLKQEEKFKQNRFIKSQKEECCSICGNTINPNLLHIFKGNISKGEVHYDNDIIICDSCLGKCRICPNCLLRIKSSEIAEKLGDWQTLYFCNCKK